MVVRDALRQAVQASETDVSTAAEGDHKPRELFAQGGSPAGGETSPSSTADIRALMPLYDPKYKQIV